MRDKQGDSLKSQAYRKARATVLKSATQCAICGQPLDHTADPRSRWAPSADHIIPRSLGGSLTAPNNLRAVHYGCNSRRGNGVTRGKGTRKRRSVTESAASRDW